VVELKLIDLVLTGSGFSEVLVMESPWGRPWISNIHVNKMKQNNPSFTNIMFMNFL